MDAKSQDSQTDARWWVGGKTDKGVHKHQRLPIQVRLCISWLRAMHH